MDQNNVVFENPQSTFQPPPQPSPVIPPAVPPQPPENPPPLPSPPPNSSVMASIPLWAKTLLGVVGLIILVLIILLVFRRGPSRSEEKVTLEYWGLWEDSNIMQSVFADFEKQHPNISIDYKKEDPKQYSQRLLTRIQNGTGPDIFRFHNSWISVFQPVLLPLSTDAITAEDFKKSFYPVAQQDLVKNGAIYGIPLEIDTLSLFVNNSIFKAAGAIVPTTWEAFANTARTLTVKDENGKIKTAGAALGTFDNITHAPDIISLLFIQNNVDMKDLEKTKKNAVDTFNFYTSFAKDQGNVWDGTLDQSFIAFYKGNLAMFFGYSYDYFTLKNLNPTLDFQAYAVPHLPGRSITIASYWAEGVSAKTKHQKEAMLFMHFLAQKETEQKFFTLESKSRLFGEPYAHVALADSVKDNQFVAPFVSQAQNAASTLFSGETYDTIINAPLNGYLGNAIKSLFVDVAPESAVDTLFQGVSQVLSKYGQ